MRINEEVKNKSPEFDTVLITEDDIITKRGEVFENIQDCANVDGVLMDIEAVTIPEETLETNPDNPNDFLQTIFKTNIFLSSILEIFIMTNTMNQK